MLIFNDLRTRPMLTDFYAVKEAFYRKAEITRIKQL